MMQDETLLSLELELYPSLLVSHGMGESSSLGSCILSLHPCGWATGFIVLLAFVRGHASTFILQQETVQGREPFVN